MELASALIAATDAALAAGELVRAEFHRPGGPRGSGGDAPVEDEAEGLIRARLNEDFPHVAWRADGGGHELEWLVDPNGGTRAFLQGHRGSSVSIALVRRGIPVLGVVYAPLAPDDRGDLFTWHEGGVLRRNGRPIERRMPTQLDPRSVVLVSPFADRNPAAYAACLAPARFRGVASISYRLALAAAGEGDAALSLSSPNDRDVAAGHALLRGVGGVVVNNQGEPLTYELAFITNVFAGAPEVARELAARSFRDVFEPRPPDVLSLRYPLLTPAPRGHVADSDLLSRAQGCLLGQLAGDALGAPFEDEEPEAINARFPGGPRELEGGGVWNTLPGQVTDDSELALILARAIVKDGGYDPARAREAYRAWLHSGPFDVPGTIARGLEGKHNELTQANGALMRVSPLGIATLGQPAETAAALAAEDAALTHPNPVCRDASGALVVALGEALRTGDRRGAHQAALAWARSNAVVPVQQILELATDGPPSDVLTQSGWVLVALHNAFHQLLHAPSLEEALASTVARGGDTDTNAAVAGALLGAALGREAIPVRWRRLLLSCRPLPGTPRPRPMSFWTVDALELADRLAWLGSEGRPEAA